jgi:hypothetical protein
LQVKRGVLYTWHEAEGKRLRNPFDTITEGVGLNRLTANFASAAVDDAVRVTDREAVEMAAYLLRFVDSWSCSMAEKPRGLTNIQNLQAGRAPGVCVCVCRAKSITKYKFVWFDTVLTCNRQV